MRKTIIISLILFLAIFSYLFLNFSPFPLSKTIRPSQTEKYKKEIEDKIDNLYPIVIKQIDEVENQIIEEKDPLEKKNILDNGIDWVLFDFYYDLIVTTRKYARFDIPSTDFTGALSEIVNSYIFDNNVNRSKIDLLEKYARKKHLEYIEKYTYLIRQ